MEDPVERDVTSTAPSCEPTLGAFRDGRGWRFRVWAQHASRVEVLLGDGVRVPLAAEGGGTFTTHLTGLPEGTRYAYFVDGRGPYPDPASRFQPLGVHGASALVDPSRFAWRDEGWRGIPLEEAVIYELHVGTFTPSGTFAAAAERLPHLRDLGVSVIELMPVADFAGSRNWGYDGVALFAPARCYGSPDDLRGLVDAAHRLGMAVVLDVVYNHFGPDGAYHGEFSPGYYSDASSPWGRAINLDREGSHHVRRFFAENALHWLHEYHLDGLRLDATHALVDRSPEPFVRELVTAVRSQGPQDRAVLLIAEDARNDVTLVTPQAAGGWGLDAVWADDLHHEDRRHVAGDRDGYFADYSGTTADIADTLAQGWFYRGQHSTVHGRARGTPTGGTALQRFVVCAQNHDQVGNRAHGDRLHHTVDLATWRAVSTLLLLAPATPLLFMGQEWATRRPFLFFTDHHEELGRAVTRGRRDEFRGFAAFASLGSESAIPDPQSPDTFARSGLDWGEIGGDDHRRTLALYRSLTALRRELLGSGWDRDRTRAEAPDAHTVTLRHQTRSGPRHLVVVRLTGAGRVHVPAVAGSTDDLRVALSTEDTEHSDGAEPITWGKADDGVTVTFRRPGAIVLCRR